MSSSQPCPIPGLKVFSLAVHSDNRGWFKENWRSEKLKQLGRDFRPVQNNVSFNSNAGVTRGFHAEPWDKYISVSQGRVFGAWVDLRAGENFGRTYHYEIGPDDAVFVPAGVANAFQALEDGTSYIYLVNGYWDAESQYEFVSIFDAQLEVPWPIPLEQAIVSEKDRLHPPLGGVKPFVVQDVYVVGASGQVGQQLARLFRTARCITRADLDLSSPDFVLDFGAIKPSWIINAAAYTRVDAAETKEGRVEAWQVNALSVQRLAAQAHQIGAGFVHYSTDYVFDGASNGEYSEADQVSPLNSYGQSKLAGEIAAATAARNFVIRTSWVIGEGNNFVRTMQAKAEQGAQVEVVNDQFGRLTFAEDLADATKALMDSEAPSGLYNITNSGQAASWFDVAREVYRLTGVSESLVRPISTEEFHAKFPGRARRPRNSQLNLSKFQEATGSVLPDWRDSLKAYLEKG